MFKSLYVVALTALFAAVAVSGAAAQANTSKFAYINSQEILRSAPDRQAVIAQFQKETAPIEARLKAINDSNVAIVTAYEKDAPTLAPEARAKREQEILDRRRVWGPESDSLREQAAKRADELERPIMDKLRRVLDEVRQEGGYWMILDVAAEGGLGIVAIDKNLDITERVLAAYRAAPAIKAGAAAPTPVGPVSPTTGIKRNVPPEP